MFNQSFLRPLCALLTICFLALPVGCAKTVTAPAKDKAIVDKPAPKALPPESKKAAPESIKEEKRKEKTVKKESETEKTPPGQKSEDPLPQNAPENVQIKGGKVVPLDGYEWVNPSDPNDFRVTPIWNK